jgi:hypothetical protein
MELVSLIEEEIFYPEGEDRQGALAAKARREAD